MINDHHRVISYINIQLSCLHFSLQKDIFNHKNIYYFSFFNNGDIYYIIDVYSDTNKSALKYLKDIEANVHNVLVMASDFNIRDNIWDLSIFFYLIYSNLLVYVANSFNLCYYGLLIKSLLDIWTI